MFAVLRSDPIIFVIPLLSRPKICAISIFYEGIRFDMALTFFGGNGDSPPHNITIHLILLRAAWPLALACLRLVTRVGCPLNQQPGIKSSTPVFIAVQRRRQ